MPKPENKALFVANRGIAYGNANNVPPRKNVLVGGEGSVAASWLEGLSLMDHFVHLQAEINLPVCWRTADQVTSHPPALWLPTPCAYCESSVGGENYLNRLESANSSV